jgi:hypothetical protein
MIPMFAEVHKDGKWHKVGKVFPSALPELEGQLTDRVYDGSNKALEDALSGKAPDLNKLNVLNIFPDMPCDASDEIATHISLTGRHVYYVYLDDLFPSLMRYSIYKTGYITEWQYKRLIKDGIQPVHIRHNIPRSTGVKVSQTEMDMILNNPTLRREDVKYFVKYEYDRHSFEKDCPFFFDKIAPVLATLYNDNDDVRIVYGIKE